MGRRFRGQDDADRVALDVGFAVEEIDLGLGQGQKMASTSDRPAAPAA